MIRRPPRSTLDRSSAASDVYKRQEELGAGTINRDDGVRQTQAPPLDQFQQLYPLRLRGKLEDRLHQFGHGIVEVQDHLRPEEPGYQTAENQKVRHVVHVHEVIPAVKRTPDNNCRGNQEEGQVLVKVAQDSASPPGDRNSTDVDPAQSLMF